MSASLCVENALDWNFQEEWYALYRICFAFRRSFYPRVSALVRAEIRLCLYPRRRIAEREIS